MGWFSSQKAVEGERMGEAFLGRNGAVSAPVGCPQHGMAP